MGRLRKNGDLVEKFIYFVDCHYAPALFLGLFFRFLKTVLKIRKLRKSGDLVNILVILYT